MIIKNITKILLLLTVFQVACSKKDPEGGKNAQIFPQKQEISTAANDTLELTFEANKTWRLESNKVWAKFLREIPKKENDETVQMEELAVIAGNIGSNTIKVAIKHDGGRFDESDIAQLKLYMEGESQVIYDITRSPKERVLDIMAYTTSSPYKYEKVDNILIDTLVNGNVRVRRFGITANYDWKILECPEWIDQPLRNLTGTADIPVTTSIDNSLIISGKNQAFGNKGDIIVAPKTDLTNQSKWVKIPVEFTGMSAVQVGIKGISKATGVLFSPTGYLTESSPSTGGDATPTQEREILFNFWTRNMAHKLEIVKYNTLSKKVEVLDKNSDDCWLKIALDAENKGNVSLSVKSADAENKSGIDKELYLYILPEKYSNINYNYDSDFINGSPKQSDYQYKIVKQTDVGFKVVHSITKEVIWATKVTDPSLSTRYGTDQIYKFKITKAFWNVNRASITITGNLWEGREYSSIPEKIWANRVEGKERGFSMSNLVPYDNLPVASSFSRYS